MKAQLAATGATSLEAHNAVMKELEAVKAAHAEAKVAMQETHAQEVERLRQQLDAAAGTSREERDAATHELQASQRPHLTA